MSHPNPSTALARVVLDELAARGVEVVIVSPGSRSAALAIAAVENPDLEVRVVIDERSAGYHALGVSRATGSPAAVIATSGTAPANYLPAVVEADAACVPLVVLSADRPAEMRGVGANQTIDQMHLYGSKVRSFAAIEAPGPDTDLNVAWRRVVGDAVESAMSPKPGPVHLNIAFREPTVPVEDDGRTRSDAYPHPTPRLEVAGREREDLDGSAIDLIGRRGVLVLGDGSYDRSAVIEQARRLGWPVLATALSSARSSEVVSSYHFVLDDGVPGDLVPDLVVAVGSIGPDPYLEDLIASASTRVRVDVWGRHIDPRRNSSAVLAADPETILGSVGSASEEGWRDRWIDRSTTARDEVVETVSAMPDPTGGGVAHALNSVEWGALVVASSLPIREVDAHLTRPGPVFANRGASGIDGFVSTALGVASEHRETVALSGDLSFLHDINGLMVDVPIDCVFVVVDNEGGGLFDALPQAVHALDYERLFVTPSGRSISSVAEAHGATAAIVKDMVDLVEACGDALARGGIHVLVVPVDRKIDLEFRSQLGR